MRGFLKPTSALASLSMAAAVAAVSPSASLACGYEDDASVARGSLNWVYPDALHVIGAISTAVAERRLPAPNFDAAAPDLFGSKYRQTAQSLEQLGIALNNAPDMTPTLSFSLVLVEPMLWTRFEAAQGELRAHVHVTGPTPGDLVLVSGEAVVSEIANGRLTIDEARKLGFIRLYGSEEQKSQFAVTYQLVGSTVPAGFYHGRAQSDLGNRSQKVLTTLLRSTSVLVTTRGASTLIPASEVSGGIACDPAHH